MKKIPKSVTGRTPSEPEMQRIPASNYLAQALSSQRAQIAMVTTNFAEIEKRVLAGMTVMGVNEVREGKDTVSRFYTVKSRGGDNTAAHEAQRLLYDAMTGRLSEPAPKGARTTDVISKRGCNGCNAKAGEGHLFDCPDLAARMKGAETIDEEHTEGQNYREVLDKLARKPVDGMDERFGFASDAVPDDD